MKKISIFFALLLCLGGVKAQFKVPKYEKFQLKNGLTVYLMEQHEVPLVYVNYVNRAGAVMDGKQSGLASFTCDALLFGAGGMRRLELEEAFDRKGATISTSAGKESATVSSSFHKDNAKEYLDLIAKVLTSPDFDEEEVMNEQNRRVALLEQAKESPRQVIGDYYDKFMYGDHPYGNPMNGVISTVKELNQAEIRKFHAANYAPNTSAIAIVGDFSIPEMKKLATEIFGAWKMNKSAAVADYKAPTVNANKARVLLVDKPDSRETTFYIGGKGIRRDNPDFVAVQVINTILGGRFTSWLNDELRVNSGLTYGARSSFRMERLSGTFAISSFTKTSTTVDAIDLALLVMERLHNKGVDQETLESAKNYIKGSFPPKYETSGDLAELLGAMYLYGYDDAFINNFEANVNAVTVEKAKEIIAKYFPKDNYQFLLIGKAEEIKEKVSKYGQVIMKEIKAEGF